MCVFTVVKSIYLNYESHLKHLSSQISSENDALAKGLAKGKAEGLVEVQRQIAARLKKEGIPLETIAQWTGLSVDEIGLL